MSYKVFTAMNKYKNDVIKAENEAIKKAKRR